MTDGAHDHAELETGLATLLDALTVHSHPPPASLPPQVGEGSIVIAAADWPYPEQAHLVCDGTDDQHEINEALEDWIPLYGGKVVLTPGTFKTRDTIRVRRDKTKLTGSGWATVIQPQPDFPNEAFVLAVEADTATVARGMVRDLAIDGAGIQYANTVNGIDLCATRATVRDVLISWLTGDGLNIRKTATWENFETKLSSLQIQSCGRYGIRAGCADQHWTNLVVMASGVSNLYSTGSGGNLLLNCHFYGGPKNPLGTQTVRNVHFTGTGSSNTQFTGCKIEHAAQNLVWLDGSTKGGSIEFVGCRFRNGSGAGPNLHSQIKVTRGGGNTWEVLIAGCRFWADASSPSYNVEAVNSNNGSPLTPLSRFAANIAAGAASGIATPNVKWE
jgi:hypothetical protein